MLNIIMLSVTKQQIMLSVVAAPLDSYAELYLLLEKVL
jgi:hypothetical protein